MKRLILSAAMLLLSATMIAAEQTAADSISPMERTLDAVVVTATRTPKLLSETPVITRLITAADIRRLDANNIVDLLETELPGLETSYSMNQQSSLRMNGFGGNSILFLVDGERLAGETLDNVDYARLNLDNVERVEIVKGAASSLYGSNAVGGVVNIITHTPEEPYRISANARYGSHNAHTYGATASFAGNRISSATTFRYNSEDEIKLTETTTSPGDISRIYAHSSYSVKEKLAYNPTAALALTARAGYFYRQRSPAATERDRYRDFSAGVKANYNLSSVSALELAYSFDQYDKSDFSTIDKLDIRNYSNVQHTVRTFYNNRICNSITLSAGGDFMRDYLMSYQFASGGAHTQYSADAFVQVDYDVTERLNVIAAARYDYFSEAAVSHASAKLSAMYKLSPLTLRASYAGGFRAPSLKEMYMNFFMGNIFMIYGNPDLKPEDSHNITLSAEFSKRRCNITITPFFSHVRNKIATVWNTLLAGQQYVNTSSLNIYGVEANAVLKITDYLESRLSYVYTKEAVKHGSPYTSATRPHSATVRLSYNHNFCSNYGIDVALSGRVLSAVTTNEYTSLSNFTSTSQVRYPAYTMWKLIATQKIHKSYAVAITIDNLLNYRPKYYYNSSPATTGTTIAVSLTANIP